MGAEVSSYQDLQLEDELPVTGDHGWTVHDARSKDDGTACSVFLHNKTSANTELLQNAAKQLKTLRHPSILKFLALTKSSHGHMLVTEHVTPLEIALEHLSASEIAGGIHNIVEALVFLHDRVGLSHNNVCLSSVYVGDDGGWRLGGMEHVCVFSDATPANLSKTRALRSEAAIAPEEKTGKVETSAEFGHARDAFAFGVLAESLLESLCELGDMTKTFELRVQDELLHPDPRTRPHLRTLLEDRLFRNEFLGIVLFLQHITLKSEEEKKVFFSGLVCKLYDLPSSLVASRLARPLVSRFVLLDPTALSAVIPHLLTPCNDKVRGEYREGEVNPILSAGQFKQYVVPELYKIFHVRDAHIRLVLLSRFSQYVHLFDTTSLQKVILPQILLGLRDTNDELVRASLLAVAELVPILGGDVVIGTHRDKIFAEGKPKFGNKGEPQRKSAPLNNGMSISQKDTTNNKIKETRTLKDIAKERDREKRREEIKQRNQERRRKREERLKAAESAENNKANSEADANTNTEDVKTESIESGSVDERNEINLTESGHGKADWSDWEGERRSDPEDDPDYDHEIEEELRQMGSASPKKSFMPIDPNPPTVDWSDATTIAPTKEPTKTRGMLKLKSKSKSSPPPKFSGVATESDWTDADWGFQDGNHGTVTPRKSASPKVQSPSTRRHESESEPDFSQSDGWGDDWDANESAAPSEVTFTEKETQKLKSKTTKLPSKQKEKPGQGGKTGKPQELGSEYDIMTIKVKPAEEKSDPFDFFSDMEPVIKAKNPLAELAERSKTEGNASTTDKDKAQTTTSSKLSFAVIDTDDGGDGWGDSGWGADEDDLIDPTLDS